MDHGTNYEQRIDTIWGPLSGTIIGISIRGYLTIDGERLLIDSLSSWSVLEEHIGYISGTTMTKCKGHVQSIF